MSIAVGCSCGQRFAVPAKLAGKTVKCPKCGRPISIPAATTAPGTTATAVQPAQIGSTDVGQDADLWGELPPASSVSPLHAPGPAPAYPPHPQAYAYPQANRRPLPWRRIAIFGGGATAAVAMLAAVGIGIWAVLLVLQSSPEIREILPSQLTAGGDSAATVGGGATKMHYSPDEVAIPYAVTSPPAGLAEGAPFDVAEFFRSPPADQNAAPLYLEAFCEFCETTAICLPQAEQTAWKKRAIRQRDNLRDAYYDWQITSGKNTEQVQATLNELQTGFDKIALAQQRPDCVFQTGLGMTALAPQNYASMYVRYAYVLKVDQQLKRGDIDAAIDDVAAILRISRDLRPRSMERSENRPSGGERTIVEQMVYPIPA